MAFRYVDRQQVFYNGADRLSPKPKVANNPNPNSNVPLYSMEHAPQDGRRVFVSDENGRKHRAMFDRNAWREVIVETDPITGERRLQQNGKIIYQPMGWHWPQKR
jgi:hypothetical protein